MNGPTFRKINRRSLDFADDDGLWNMGSGLQLHSPEGARPSVGEFKIRKRSFDPYEHMQVLFTTGAHKGAPGTIKDSREVDGELILSVMPESMYTGREVNVKAKDVTER